MKKTVHENIQSARKLLDAYEADSVEKVVRAGEIIIESYKKGGTVYLCGNGGSASDCQHIAGELIGRFLINRDALPAVSLTADTAVLTCIGNDFGFENVFSKQLEGLAEKGDVLWAFSTSGTSKNIINAAEVAKNKGVSIIAFTGRLDTPLEKMADVCVSVDATYAAPAQQIHELAYHTICQIVEAKMFKS